MPRSTEQHEVLIRSHPHLKEFLPFLDAHNTESPRGSVLISYAYLDEQLCAIIDAFLIEGSDKGVLLNGFNAPLGTFAARIKAAHCLGLISDLERDDCDTLRKIRNEFAHSHRVSFDDMKISDLCKNFHHSAKSPSDMMTTFGLFSTAAVGLILALINRAHYVAEERLTKRTWRR